MSTPDAQYPAITYEWLWASRVWRAVAHGAVIIAHAPTAEGIVARAWSWALSNLDML